jgi:hypothetical protein
MMINRTRGIRKKTPPMSVDLRNFAIDFIVQFGYGLSVKTKYKKTRLGGRDLYEGLGKASV